MAAGICCGFSSMVNFYKKAAGLAIGIIGDSCVRANA